MNTTNSLNGDLPAADCTKNACQSDKIEWEGAVERVLSWFLTNKIERGNPEELIHLHQEKQRKIISGYMPRNDEILSNGLLGKRLGRKLTISL